jgi:hypothetical protein
VVVDTDNISKEEISELTKIRDLVLMGAYLDSRAIPYSIIYDQ